MEKIFGKNFIFAKKNSSLKNHQVNEYLFFDRGIDVFSFSMTYPIYDSREKLWRSLIVLDYKGNSVPSLKTVHEKKNEYVPKLHLKDDDEGLLPYSIKKIREKDSDEIIEIFGERKVRFGEVYSVTWQILQEEEGIFPKFCSFESGSFIARCKKY